MAEEKELLDIIGQQAGNGAFERMRNAPDSHIKRMKSLYGQD